MRIECAGIICLEPFKKFAQMGRFTLRDESRFHCYFIFFPLVRSLRRGNLVLKLLALAEVNSATCLREWENENNFKYNHFSSVNQTQNYLFISFTVRSPTTLDDLNKKYFKLLLKKIKIKSFMLYPAHSSFMLYPAHSRVGRENVVLRHSVPHFLPNSGGIAC